MEMFTDFGTFGIGVALSSTDGLNGWRLTSDPAANANVFWLYDPNHSALATDEGAFLFSSAAWSSAHSVEPSSIGSSASQLR